MACPVPPDPSPPTNGPDDDDSDDQNGPDNQPSPPGPLGNGPPPITDPFVANQGDCTPLTLGDPHKNKL